MIPNLEDVPEHLRPRLVEAIERSLRSYVFFCRYWLKFTPHRRQREFADERLTRVFMSCGSGLGKSVGIASFLLWMAFKHPRHDYAAIAPTSLQAGHIMEDMGRLILAGGNRLSFLIARTPTKDAPWLVLTTGARILFFHTARGADHLRGFEFNGVAYDEAAMDRELAYQIIRTRARLRPGWVRVTSTPKGKNWFFREAMLCREEEIAAQAEGRPPKRRLIVGTSWDNPHYAREILEDFAASMPRELYRQEIMGEFVDAGGTFRQDDIDRVFDASWKPETEPRRGGLYATGWDYGRKTTYTVGTTLAYDQIIDVPGEVRGIVQDDHLGERWTRVFELVNEREAYWGGNQAERSETIHDATGIGDVIDQSIDISAMPYIFTQKSRGELLLRFIKAFETPNRLRFPRHWTRLYGSCQLHTAKEDAPGETWDHLDSTALAYWLAHERTSFGTPFLVG